MFDSTPLSPDWCINEIARIDSSDVSWKFSLRCNDVTFLEPR